MTLTTKERLLLLTALPKEGDITTVRIVRQLRESLSFTEEEHVALGLTTDDGQVKWNAAAPQERDIEVAPKAHVIVQTSLQELDNLSLWDKFCTD
jgi:hypothetical protein